MPPIPPNARPIAVWFHREVSLPLDDTAASKLREVIGRDWDDFAQANAPGAVFQPFFADASAADLAELDAVQPVQGTEPFSFRTWYRIWCPPGLDYERIAKAVREWPGVRRAYVEGVPRLPGPPAEPRAHRQGYLDPAPAGIDAYAAWRVATGAGVGFVDLEADWQLNHVEFPASISKIWGDFSGVDQHKGHGTNTLGVVIAQHDGQGIAGLAPDANSRVVSHCFLGSLYHTTEAIRKAARTMNRGDVLLLEVEVYRLIRPEPLGGETAFPAEVDLVVFQMILNVVSRGIVVVQAAGNGTRDLDLQEDETGAKIFDRWFRDSGAILVAAGNSTDTAPPRAPYSTTNFGTRVDCFAWGEGVYTSGYNGPSITNHYISNFTGTSAAAAIVAGAALLLQSWKKSDGGAAYSPLELRAKLADQTPNVNTASAHGVATDKIGVMPNLAKLIPRPVTPAAINGHLAAIRRILAGVIQDGGGIEWKPGKGPVPVDPWGPLLAQLDPAERDLVVGAAALDLARHASNKSLAKRLAKSARRALKDARKKAKRER